MNWDQIQGYWKQLAGSARAQWATLMHDERGIVAGRLYQLAGQAQRCYGLARFAADRQLALDIRNHDSACQTKGRVGRLPGAGLSAVLPPPAGTRRPVRVVPAR
jgi:uncharacterized protein YjbJ (UPF0337 family)